ncbi:hypothetical protein DBR32_09630 [Taibaiella sp. KBW10]|nr:hypothetical protein DBR32_09630 [Taibaiella sp. KBW10]
MVVAVLFIAGAQVPVTPFVEVVGSGLKLAPAQTGATCVNTGVVPFTVMVIVTSVAHCPAVGLKVYVVVVVLFKAGDQVPVTPFVEVVGKGLIIAP